ncbi:hypothetical protein [uncultured Fusobacterium sp.]|uniref:hypothetical protein n=1 Tax=uncultured Fusobacterium sp. TaxID=159267 RepID=UPI00265F4AB5|nr:hypothetical protein [uncultured Fusobacterium sp.]
MYFYNNKKKKYRYYEQKEKNKLDFSAVDRDLEELKLKEKEYEKKKIKKFRESNIEEFGFALDYDSSNFYSPYYRPYNYNGGGYNELDWQERAENYASNMDQLSPMQEIIYEYGGSKLLEELYKRFKHLNVHFINDVVEAIDEAIEKNELFTLDDEDINARLFYYAITLFASSTNMFRYIESSEIDIKSFAKHGLYDFNLVNFNEPVSKIMENVYKEKEEEKRKREKEEERKRKEEAKRQYLANRKIKTLFGYKYTEKEFQNMMEIIRKKRAEGLNYSEIIYLGIMKLK